MIKNKLLILLTTVGIISSTFASVEPMASCDTIWDTTSCEACFKETSKLYACNPYQATCQNQQIGGMYDVVHNTWNTNLVMYDDDKWTINFTKLQAATTWSYQDTVTNMFEATPEYYTNASVSGEQWYQHFTGSNSFWYLMKPSTSLKWTQMKTAGWLRSESVTQAASWILPAFRVSFTPRLYSNATTYLDHRQCVFYYVRFCGDGTPDTERGEQCDDGNMVNGDGCSNTCMTEATPTLSCTNLTLTSTPATLTKAGWTLTATCSASNATHYKFILKQGATIIDTKEYQVGTQATFTLPENSTSSSKGYTVDCLVKKWAQLDITSDSCKKSISVPGTTTVPAECESLTLTPATANTNTPIDFVCAAKNPTSNTTYTIVRDGIAVGTQPIGTMNLSTPKTYTIKCIVDDKVPTPAACIKTVTITTPPPSPIPSIFIDKDDSTPGDPDSDGNDIQRVQENGTATFTIRVENNGNEVLKTVVVTDQYAPDCNRTSTQTAALYAGGTSTNFDIGESFTYTCTKTNVTSSTFPNNRNTATVTGVWVTSSQNVTDSDVTEIFLKQQIGNPNIKIEKNDTDNLDDTQEIEEGDTATFSVKVTNNGQESLENITITDELSKDCERNISETRDLVRKYGNHDSLFDPGETFAYSCNKKSVNSNTFPDEKNTVCTSARWVDSKGWVSDCDDTEITLIIPDSTPSMCEAIESSEGTFGGAPFRTQITCQTTDSTSDCSIEVSKDGSIVNTYNSCTKNITFSNPWDYSIACIVDDEISPECEMSVTVEAMTDVQTGTKIIMVGLLSLLFTLTGMYFYKKRTT